MEVEHWIATAKRLAKHEGALETKRVLAASESGAMGTISQDDLVKLIMGQRANATMGDRPTK